MKKMRNHSYGRKWESLCLKTIISNLALKQKQISGNAIETKFVPQYMCIFMNDLEIKFLKGQHLQLLVFILMMLLFIWTHGKESYRKFLEELNGFNQYIKFAYEHNVENSPFLDLKVKLQDGKIDTDLHVRPTDRHLCLHFSSSHPNKTKRSVFFRKFFCINRLFSKESDFE